MTKPFRAGRVPGPYTKVMSHVTDNNLEALEPMMSTSVFDAFRDTW